MIKNIIFDKDRLPEAIAEELKDKGAAACGISGVPASAADSVGFFASLPKSLGLSPEECLFVACLKAGAGAVKKAGMKCIVFEDRDQLAGDLAQAIKKDASHNEVTVLCYGDSNTYGYDPSTGGRYPHKSRWTTILGELLGDGYEVINEGLNGRTTAYDRPGAAWKNGVSSFIACLGTHKPVDILIIMLGTNDCNAGLGLSAEQIAGGMENLVRLAEENAPALQGYVPRIIVAAPAAIREDYEGSPFAYELSPASVKKSHDIAPLYRELAERHGCDFADATKAAEVSELDSEHLSERGHRQMAELFFETIRG